MLPEAASPYVLNNNRHNSTRYKVFIYVQALRVHVDQTPESAANRVKRHVPELAEELLEHRYQIINLWRPISHPAMESPLAVCDYRSIDLEKDLVPTDLRYPNQKREIFTVNYNPAHKWKYLKGMTPEEAILFKW